MGLQEMNADVGGKEAEVHLKGRIESAGLVVGGQYLFDAAASNKSRETENLFNANNNYLFSIVSDYDRQTKVGTDEKKAEKTDFELEATSILTDEKDLIIRQFNENELPGKVGV